MQIVRFERSSFELFCPVTGRPVLDENQEPNTPTFRGSWVELEELDQPKALCAELDLAWQEYRKKIGATVLESELVAFLESVDQPDWVAFAITVYDNPHREVWFSTWTVLDLGWDQDRGYL
jgi:hypothetical protein